MAAVEELGIGWEDNGGRMPPLFDRLIDYIEYHAERVPDRPALVSDTRAVSWGDLPAEVDRLADALVDHGVVRGERVAAWVPPTVDGILIFLACARLGAIFVGVNPKYQLDEVDYILSDARPRVMFVGRRTGDRDYAPELRELAQRETGPLVVAFDLDVTGPAGLSEFAGHAQERPRRPAEMCDAVQPEDPVTIVYTSGTTGKPKGALLTQQGFAHNYWRAFRERYMEWLKVPAFFTINHAAGLGDVAAIAFVAGGTQYLMQRFDPERIIDLIESERLTYLPGLVTHFQLIFRKVDVSGRDLSSIEYIWWGGALIPLDLLDRLLAICPRASTDFGQTETHGPLIYTPVDASLSDKSLTIGRIFDRGVVRIADESGAVCAPGTSGEIQAHGTQTAPGYWGNAEGTRALYTDDGWLRTGDLAVERDDGYVVMVGRISEMFKSGGYNVYPAEVEAVIADVPGVDMVVVVSIPDELYQEIGMAFVTAKRGSSVSPSGVLDHARAKLANYKVPKQVHVFEELPRTLVGKIDKPALRAIARGDASGSGLRTEDTA